MAQRGKKNSSIVTEISDFQCCYIEGKGRGVFATKNFEKGSFVVEYSGDFISLMEANMREAQYATDETTGCYMYYFRYNDQTFW